MYTTDDASVSFILRLTGKELKTKVSLIDCHASQFPEENGRYLGAPFILLRLFLGVECYSGWGPGFQESGAKKATRR
jgi:hypothetical protein